MNPPFFQNTYTASPKAIIFALVLSVSSSLAMAENSFEISPEQINNLGVQLGKLESASQQPILTAPAKITIPPEHEYIVSAPQAGLISKLHSSVGDHVKKGVMLAQLNSPELLALQGRYLKALSTLNLAAANHQRDKKLLHEGVIASRREQETLGLYNAAVLDVNEIQQLLAIAGMSANAIQQLKANHQLNSSLRIRAPISGVVLERMAVAGTRVDILAPLYRIANLAELWLEINIPQERLADIQVGHTVWLENTRISAKITLLGESVNPENQTLVARAVIQGGHKDIRPGQRVNIQIMQDTDNTLYSIPNTAIAQHEGNAYVFVRTAKGFSVNEVDVVGKQGDTSTVSGDFNGSENIATHGAAALKANWLGLGGNE